MLFSSWETKLLVYKWQAVAVLIHIFRQNYCVKHFNLNAIYKQVFKNEFNLKLKTEF